MVKFEEIVEVHAAMVRRIATVYERHPDRVDDLAQDVWIAVTGFSWVECIEAVAYDVRVLFARLKSLSLATVKSF